jgi:hypothetical protein
MCGRTLNIKLLVLSCAALRGKQGTEVHLLEICMWALLADAERQGSQRNKKDDAAWASVRITCSALMSLL